MKKKVIGLLGGTGAGKSTAARWLEQHGVTVIDADDVSKELMQPEQPGFDAVVAEFGSGILSPDGTIDRRRLGRIVFSNPAQRERLERAVHPLMVQRITEKIAASDTAVTVLDCAVLLRPAFRPLVDEIWMISAPADTRMERIMKRDGLSSADALDRISAQNTDEELRNAASIVISNEGAAEDLYAKLESVLR